MRPKSEQAPTTNQSERRFMRLLVFFDLPVKTREERRIYTHFRRFLITDGYDMLQYSVYGRIINGHDAEEKHLRRLKMQLPPKGSVRALTVTEKQFASMQILVGARSFQEKTINSIQLSLF